MYIAHYHCCHLGFGRVYLPIYTIDVMLCKTRLYNELLYIIRLTLYTIVAKMLSLLFLNCSAEAYYYISLIFLGIIFILLNHVNITILCIFYRCFLKKKCSA